MVELHLFDSGREAFVRPLSQSPVHSCDPNAVESGLVSSELFLQLVGRPDEAYVVTIGGSTTHRPALVRLDDTGFTTMKIRPLSTQLPGDPGPAPFPCMLTVAALSADREEYAAALWYLEPPGEAPATT